MNESDEEDDVPTLVNIDSNRLRMPVTLLSGFLGSGKSTLLNYILSQNHGKRIAVIENEFSQGFEIDKLIATNSINGTNLDNTNFFELNNGCICCTVKDNLLTTLEQLVLHKEKFDYIIIEVLLYHVDLFIYSKMHFNAMFVYITMYLTHAHRQQVWLTQVL